MHEHDVLLRKRQLAEKFAAELEEKLAEKEQIESEVVDKRLVDVALLRNALQEKFGCAKVFFVLFLFFQKHFQRHGEYAATCRTKRPLDLE